MKNRRAVGLLNPIRRDKKLKARTGGENGRHLGPRLIQKLESKVREKKKKKGKKRVGSFLHKYVVNMGINAKLTSTSNTHNRRFAIKIHVAVSNVSTHPHPPYREQPLLHTVVAEVSQ